MKWLQKLLGLPELAKDAREARANALAALSLLDRAPPPPPPPYVAALIMGEGPDGPLMMGKGALLTKAEFTFDFDTYFPLRDVRVVVFCDLSRVQVNGVFCGVNHQNGCVGECPMAFFPRWELGCKVRIPCYVRR